MLNVTVNLNELAERAMGSCQRIAMLRSMRDESNVGGLQVRIGYRMASVVSLADRIIAERERESVALRTAECAEVSAEVEVDARNLPNTTNDWRSFRITYRGNDDQEFSRLVKGYSAHDAVEAFDTWADRSDFHQNVTIVKVIEA